MWRIILITACVFWEVNNAQPSLIRTAVKNKRSAGSYAGSYAGSNAGPAVHFYDYDDYAPYFGFGYNFMDPYAFHQQLTSQILADNAAHQNAIASSVSMGDATVTASASNLPNEIQDYDEYIQRQHAAIADNIKRISQNNGRSGNRYAPNYAAAGASIGPGGGHQTAYISPANPAIPNISTRFASSSPGGFKGVSVSSYSSSSDINGKKTSHRGAQTTINDNGRITTYKVNS